ncbi:reverse transcriptase domain-containing protein, partial [Tanacetum coccineum]
MRTRSQSRRRRQQQTLPVVENFDLEEPIVEQNVVPMADNRTMAQMLQAPIEGYEDAIVVPPINANNFELKQPLINLVQSNKFTGRQDPHNHLRFFNKVTSTFRHPEVPNTSIKLLLFPFSLDGEARDWLDKEPPRSILTWDDLVSKFINQYFPPSKTTYYRNEIITFYQKPNEAFNEAWERFKGLLRQLNNMVEKVRGQEIKYKVVEVAKEVAEVAKKVTRVVKEAVENRGREAAIGLTWEESKIRGMVVATEQTTIQSAILKAGVLTDKAIRNGALKKNIEKRGNGGE